MSSKTRKITTIAVLSALSLAAVAFIRIPVVLFLKYEPKDVIITTGGMLWGPLVSASVSVVVSVIEMFLLSEDGFWGLIMNIIASCAFACPAAYIYHRKKTLSRAVLGLGVGCLSMVATMLLWNYIVTPIYLGLPRKAVVEMLLPAFLPFNLLKGGLNAAITLLLYKPLVTALRKTGVMPEGPVRQKSRMGTGVLLLALGVVATCVLVILSLNGVI